MKSEREPLSPAEKAAKVRRCARAIQQGRQFNSLRKSYTWTEIEQAREMLAKAEEK